MELFETGDLPAVKPLPVVVMQAAPGSRDEDMTDEILAVLQMTITAARENPTVNTINAVVKAFSALKMAQNERGAGNGKRRSKKTISRKVIRYIESEILGIQRESSDEREKKSRQKNR